jgi:mannobiose 2-epimerase
VNHPPLHSGILSAEMENELRDDILPFWPRYIDKENGGFYGQVENDGRCDVRADKGLVMHARLLWTYSAASRLLIDPGLLATAGTAYRFLAKSLYDEQRKGFYFICDYKGNPRSSLKVVYGQAFAMYALAEYARAGGPPQALDLALETFRHVQRSAHDDRHGGYFEAVAPDWSANVASALGEQDSACAKSMNTNLHVLEALTSLHAASGDPTVAEALRELLLVHLDRILTPSGHLGLYFDADWSRLDDIVSYGHDIEASWLLTEAAERTGDDVLEKRARQGALAMAKANAAILDENKGSLPNELKDGRLDTDRIWWVQAEGIVGHVNAWELSGDPASLARATRLWEFVKSFLIDRAQGEWFWGVRHPGGEPLEDQYKGGLWKASYHNGRACMEVMKRAARDRGAGGARQ